MLVSHQCYSEIFLHSKVSNEGIYGETILASAYPTQEKAYMVWTYQCPSMTLILRRFQVLGRLVGHLIRVLGRSSEQNKTKQKIICKSMQFSLLLGCFFFFFSRGLILVDLCQVQEIKFCNFVVVNLCFVILGNPDDPSKTNCSI